MYIKENLTFLDCITTINLSEPTMPYKLKLVLCVALVAVITSVDGGICVKIRPEERRHLVRNQLDRDRCLEIYWRRSSVQS